jgi:hypothetical protein
VNTDDRVDRWHKAAGPNPPTGPCWRCGQMTHVIQVFTFEVGPHVTAEPGEPLRGRFLCLRCFLETR